MGSTWRESSAGAGPGEAAGGGSGGTWREPVPAGSGAGSGTLFEGRAAGAGGLGPVQHNLLPVLAGRFVADGDLGSGGEADVLLVRDAAGAQWVVKQYREPGWGPAAEVLDALAAAGAGRDRGSWAADPARRHVLWLREWGEDPATGRFFEVQEYLPGGALAHRSGGVWSSRLGDWPAGVVAGAAADAVAGFHEVVGSAHRDVTPANLLVRSADPLVLVLADVGLSRLVGASSVRFSRRDGVAAYQAPEAAGQGKVSRAGDWWAVGVVAAEAALGRHPLALRDGSLPDERVLQAELIERPVPLDGIGDPRLLLLCQGLLTVDTGKRWGLGQITEWRAGGSPPTGYWTPPPAGRVRSVRFAGADHATPQGLAAAFAADPQRAGELLFAAKDPVLLEDLRLLLAGHGLHEAQSAVDRYRSEAWQQPFLRLLAEMDPALPPVLEGQDMTPDGVAALARRVIEAGQAAPGEQRALGWVLDHDLWRIWRGLPGMHGAADAAERFPDRQRLREALETPARHSMELRTSADAYVRGASPIVRVWSALLAADPAASAALSRALAAAPRAHGQQWWFLLADSPAVEDRVAALATTGLADMAAQTERDRAREAEAAARREEEHRRQQEHAAQQVRNRARRTSSMKVIGVIAVLIAGYVAVRGFAGQSSSSDSVEQEPSAAAGVQPAWVRSGTFTWGLEQGVLVADGLSGIEASSGSTLWTNPDLEHPSVPVDASWDTSSEAWQFFDLRTGQVSWTTQGIVMGVYGGLVYVHYPDPLLSEVEWESAAHDRATGAVLWKVRSGPLLQSDDSAKEGSSGPQGFWALAGGSRGSYEPVFVGSSGVTPWQGPYCPSLWETTQVTDVLACSAETVTGTPFLSQGSRIDPATGAPVWVWQQTAEGSELTVAGADEYIVAQAGGDAISARAGISVLDNASGAVVWQTVGRVEAVCGSSVVVSTDQDSVRFLDLASGAEVGEPMSYEFDQRFYCDTETVVVDGREVRAYRIADLVQSG